jgi:hypothetical protein
MEMLYAFSPEFVQNHIFLTKFAGFAGLTRVRYD